MTTNVGYATLSVIPSFDGFERRLERGTSGAFTGVGNRQGTRFGNSLGGSAGQAFGRTFKTLAKVGVGAALAATAGAIKIGADALGEAREAQKVQRQTNAVLKSTGKAAKVSARDVSKLAGRLSFMAGVDDELIQQGENVLLTFKGVRNEAGKGNKVFDRATKVALNMSTALGTDLKGSVIQVGKALNDPIKGLTALSRVGVTFTEDQKEQIKTLVENGHTLKAQKIILQELGSEFGGSARSQASATDRLEVAFGNVEEQLGKGLLPVVQDFSRFLLREGVPAARQFVRWFKNEGIPNIKRLGEKLEPLAEKLLPAAKDGFKGIRDMAEDALPFATGIVDSFNNMPPWVKKVLIAGAAGGFAAKKLGLGNVGKSVAGSLFSRGATPANPLYVFTVNGGGGPGGKLGKVPLLGSLLSAGQFVALTSVIAGGITAGVGKVLGPENHQLLTAGSGGTGGGWLSPKMFQDTDKAIGKVDEFNRKLSESQRAFFDSKSKANDYFQFLKLNRPPDVSTRFTVTGVDTASAKIEAYLALLERVSTHITSGFSADGTTGSTPGQVPNHTPSRTQQTEPPTRGGVVFTGPINVTADDPKAYLQYLQNKAHRASSDGVRR